MPGTFICCGGLSSPVNIVAPDVHSEYSVTLKVKERAQVTFDGYGVNGSLIERTQTMDFVRAKSRVKRVSSKDRPSLAGRFLLRVGQSVKAFLKLLRGAEPIGHGLSHGGRSLRACSMST
jgi:hypothetical protein